MPRSGRGGRRTGTPGTQYQNRSDMPNPQVPIAAAPGQEYGQATAQRNAQKALPMAAAPIVAPGAAPSPPAPGSDPQGGPPPVTGLPAGIPAPGSLPPIDAPTDRPNENLMTGVDAGPGPGVEALQPLIAHPLVQGVAALNATPGLSPQLAAIRDSVAATVGNQATP